MSKIWVITLLGLFIALIPFLGFPGSVRTILIVLSGLFVAVLSFKMFVEMRYANTSFMNVFREEKPSMPLKVDGGITVPSSEKRA